MAAFSLLIFQRSTTQGKILTIINVRFQANSCYLSPNSIISHVIIQSILQSNPNTYSTKVILLSDLNRANTVLTHRYPQNQ